MKSTRHTPLAALLALGAMTVLGAGNAQAAVFKFFDGDHAATSGDQAFDQYINTASGDTSCGAPDVCGTLLQYTDGALSGIRLDVTATGSRGGIVRQDIHPDYGGLGVHDDYNDNITNEETLIFTFRSVADNSLVDVKISSLILFDHGHKTTTGYGNPNNNWSPASTDVSNTSASAAGGGFKLNGLDYDLPYDTCGGGGAFNPTTEAGCGVVDLTVADGGLIGSTFVFQTKDPHPYGDNSCGGTDTTQGNCSGWDNEWSYYVNALNVEAVGGDGPGSNPDDIHAPEPGTLLMLAAGLIGVGMRRRRTSVAA